MTYTVPCKGRRYTRCDLKPSLHVITQDDNLTKLNCFLKHDNLGGKPTQ